MCIPQNNPHDTVIIVEVCITGGRIFGKFTVGAALQPNSRAIYKSVHCLYIRPLTFEPLFQGPPPPRPPSGASNGTGTAAQWQVYNMAMARHGRTMGATPLQGGGGEQVCARVCVGVCVCVCVTES